MGSGKPVGGRRDDKIEWPVTMRSGENEEPNLICDNSVPENGVLRINLLLGDCCQGEDNTEPFVWNSRPRGQMSFTVYSPAHSDDPCGQTMTRTRSNDLPCLPGGSAGQTTYGAAVGGSNGDGDGSAAEMETGKNGKKKKKRAVRGIRGGKTRIQDGVARP